MSSSSQNSAFVTDTDSSRSSSNSSCNSNSSCSNNTSGNYKIITEIWNNGTVAELTECILWPIGSSLPTRKHDEILRFYFSEM